MRGVSTHLVSISRKFFKSANHLQVKVGCNYEGEEWYALWDGSAKGRVDFLLNGGSQEPRGSNELRFRTGRDPDEARLTLTIDDPDDPPRNVRVFQARYRKNIEDGEIFNPDWLTEIRRFGAIRFMDWMSTNNSTIREFDQLAGKSYFAWGQLFRSDGTNDEFGPKGSLHPEIICELLRLTGASAHVCLPIQASDAFVRSIAAYFRDHTSAEVTFELSNECWNQTFLQFKYCVEQGLKRWPRDSMSHLKWYGRRASECMKLVSDVYQDPTRWRGGLATQTVDPNKTLAILAGVNNWRREQVRQNAWPVSRLFKSMYVAGYFGDAVSAREIDHIDVSEACIVSCKGHGFREGQRVKLYVNHGAVQLNDRYFTISKPTADTFELLGVYSVAMGKHLPDCRLATSSPLPSGSHYENGTEGVGSFLQGEPGRRLTVDEFEVNSGDVLLVKDQVQRLQNGLYEVKQVGDQAFGWRLARVSYFDRSEVMLAGSATRVRSGSNANLVFKLDQSVERVGFVDISFKQVEPRNYVVDAAIFTLIDDSIKVHNASPKIYASRYTYFNSEMAQAMIQGKADGSGFSIDSSVHAMSTRYWRDQLSIAQLHNLTLRQYEGGCGLAGEGPLNGNPRSIIYGGNDQFGEFVFQFGHSEQAAAAYAATFNAFAEVGGEVSSKFVADGRSSNAGTWAGVRYWPLAANKNQSDADNPVWLATVAANWPKSR